MQLFRKYLIPTMLNVLGLSIALTAFYLFMMQVIFNYTYNSSIPNAERTYRLELIVKDFGDNWFTNMPMPIIAAMQELPQVEATASTAYNWEMEASSNENKFKVHLVKMLQGSPELFGMKPIYGSLKDFGIEKCILTRSEALRIFGKENAVGEVIKTASNSIGMATVCAVVEDMPENMLVKNGLYMAYNNELKDRINNFNYDCYVRLKNESDKDAVEKAIKRFTIESFGGIEDDVDEDLKLEMRLTPVNETWLSGIDNKTDQGNKDVTNVLLGGMSTQLCQARFLRLVL